MAPVGPRIGGPGPIRLDKPAPSSAGATGATGPNRQGLAPPAQSPGVGPTGHRNGPGAMQTPGPLVVVVVGLSVDPIGPIAIIEPRQPLPPGQPGPVVG